MSIKIIEANKLTQDFFTKLFNRAKDSIGQILPDVYKIIEEVKKSGDFAVKDFNLKFDKIQSDQLIIKLSEERPKIDKNLEKALNVAFENIMEFHKLGIPKNKKRIIFGNTLGFKNVPMDSVGIYVPGGTALYPSSVLMGVIPAKLAGVENIQIITPPASNGEIHPVIKFAGKLAGANSITLCGGAHGIAASAFGTESISKVDFIAGPGNKYVTAAKSILASLGQVGIDSPAGPSEILIIADSSGNPEWIAADLLSQAEHGSESVAILATNSKNLAESVQKEIDNGLKLRLNRVKEKKESIHNNSFIMIFETMEECFQFSNKFAPEHLEIHTKNFKKDLKKIKHAGSVFLGPYSPVALGDYISGTNHILPTAGGAKTYSSVSVNTFLKRMTYQIIQKKSLIKMNPYVQVISEIEGFQGEHGNSVNIRVP